MTSGRGRHLQLGDVERRTDVDDSPAGRSVPAHLKTLVRARTCPSTQKGPHMRAFPYAPKRTRTSTGESPQKALNLVGACQMRPARDIRLRGRGSRDGCDLADACGRGNCCHEGVAAVVSRARLPTVWGLARASGFAAKKGKSLRLRVMTAWALLATAAARTWRSLSLGVSNEQPVGQFGAAHGFGVERAESRQLQALLGDAQPSALGLAQLGC